MYLISGLCPKSVDAAKKSSFSSLRKEEKKRKEKEITLVYCNTIHYSYSYYLLNFGEKELEYNLQLFAKL